MCQIIIKEKHVAFPKIEELSLFSGNFKHACNDGFSLAWTENGIVRTFQKIDLDLFINQYKAVSKLDPEETALIIHMRNGTTGGISVNNCHCWTFKNKIAFATNGTINYYRLPKGYSDSRFFFEKELLAILNEEQRTEEMWKSIERTLIGHKENYHWMVNHLPQCNRFALINCQGEIRKYGEYCLMKGCYYSNKLLMDSLKLQYDNTALYFGLGMDVNHYFEKVD